ncbi:MAG: hydrogenase nickel incorporation protein HypB [Deltaproteobacteria bacterium]|nr:hydrogenase nickel incorporation protein HypB [Deltaproteobacteria bacterium]
MCEDCGCMEGNEKAYAQMSANQNGHSHDQGHAQGHSHSHAFDSGAQEKEIHIHIHVEAGVNVHVHTHTTDVASHRHPHVHTHNHGHSHDGNAHVHPHEHTHAHPHEHGAFHEHTHDHAHDHATEPAHVHSHSHSHSHAHAHGGDGGHFHAHDSKELRPSEQRRSRTIALETNVLANNDAKAEKNRNWLAKRGVVAVNLISSPGSGKTFLLEKTLDALRGEIACAVITGDMQTDNDARRMMGKGANVVQIETRSACHLDARQIEERLGDVIAGGVQLLFIENVGNLVCPAAFDLGEQEKIALLSVSEGEDKPLKYPVLFHGAGVTVITKTDLLPHLEVDINAYKASVHKIQPGARIIEVSAKTGVGMDDWLAYLRQLVTKG